ncbi:MAG: hypothetical protein CFH41_02838 [Alphaproteobacteria bacterium MarineAlpha11_Bin1]|nr:MAG: hypothetical protein CFH41_02838 [Alphaproteobacteria bacterium MarineAlpha11_Bin1]|tara:strand:+ start:1301 stop:1468 length:168 start_codon:yes stop_codon:yes gene_type:complete
MFLFDAKQESKRVIPGRKKSDRIYRVRSDLQKLLDCRIAYVDIDTRDIYIVPPID